MMKENYVDMGNGVLWATSNITLTSDGNYKLADNPWDYGCYFSWGDVVGHNSIYCHEGYEFNYDNYNSGASGIGHKLKRAFKSGNPTYDSAAATLGNNWRMPTRDDFEWLINNCTPIWMRLNGVNGRLFTNPNDPSKTLFFPAAGDYYRTIFGSDRRFGSYWSAKCKNFYEACALDFSSYYCGIGIYPRDRGLSIRPIRINE